MYTLFISVLVMVPAVVLHELAHGVAAFWLGDPTAKEQQRLTLNPFAHVTWFGTFVLPALLAVAGLPILGYAKPVPVDPRHFREPRKHMAWVAMAGPLTNIVLAFACVLFINFVLPWAQPGSKSAAIAFAHAGASFWPGGWIVAGTVAFEALVANLVLALFNLVPVPPLDGSRVLSWLLPRELAGWYSRLERVGLWLVFGLLYAGVFGWLFDYTLPYLLEVLL